MTYAEVEGTQWPVDDEDVEWGLRYRPESISSEDKRFAAAVMAAYSHLTDPLVDEEDAQAALVRGRAAVAAVREQEAERLSERVVREWTVEVTNEEGSGTTRYLLGPYSRSDAEAKAEEHRKTNTTDKVALIRMQS